MSTRDRFSSRKFLVVLLALTMSFILAMLGKLTADFSMVISIVVPVYVGGQSYVDGQKIKANGHDGDA